MDNLLKLHHDIYYEIKGIEIKTSCSSTNTLNIPELRHPKSRSIITQVALTSIKGMLMTMIFPSMTKLDCISLHQWMQSLNIGFLYNLNKDIKTEFKISSY